MLIKQFAKEYAGKSGVYAIKNIYGKILYIGSSKELGDAYSRHKAMLRNGSYYETNKHALQLLFNDQDLIFTVLKTCHEDELVKEETKYIKLYKDTIVNKDCKGKRRTNKSTYKEKMKRRRANSGEKNPHNTKLSESDVKQIKMLLLKGVSVRELAEQYQVSKSLIYNIRNGSRWASVKIDDENYKPIITITKENEHVLHPKMTDERRKKIALMQKRADIISENMTVSKASLPVLEGRAAEKFLEDMKRAKIDPKIFKGAKQKLKEICDELGL